MLVTITDIPGVGMEAVVAVSIAALSQFYTFY
jgi:molybdenum cofactor biosynthesis enzyme